ncbi:hypothetical protein HK097_010716 [Rhizophlyctis rosea]|uniref:Uncharacterized protein n=1 Tax=Rhizophlyctis rosea TaxID=64517 RepID=A0AAD5X3X9_9FUNG|nr:hypothetical protein HK097_010716 [Rhizophlyctis rosea]
MSLVGVHVPMGGEQIVGRVVTRVVAPEGKSLKVSVMWSLDVGNVDGEGITVDAKEVTTDGGAQRKGRMADFDEDDETEDEGLSSRRKWTARFSVRKSEITTRCFEFAIPFGGEGSVLAAMRNLTRWSGIGDDEDDSIDVQLRMQVFCVVGERVLQDDSAVEGHVIDAEISLRQEEH